jgi:dTDP-4-dehydrorhamnose reductase
MNIGITGASGMLGASLINKLYIGHKIYATSRTRGITRNQVSWNCFDLLDFNVLEAWIESNSLDVVIICGSIVNVDYCENNPEITEKINYRATEKISDILRQTKGRLVYISTDSVFDGKKNNLYTEKDKTNPLNIYSKTKLAGEGAVLNIKNGLVLRTNIVGKSSAENLSLSGWIIDRLVKSKPLILFDDVIFSPLHVDFLSGIILELIERRATGLYNVVSSTSLSKYEFGLMIADKFGLNNSNIIKGSVKDKKFIADRPLNMSLSGEKLNEVMCPRDESHLTLEFDDHYVICPSIDSPFVDDFTKNPLGEIGVPVSQNYEYCSGVNSEWLSSEKFLNMVNNVDYF